MALNERRTWLVAYDISEPRRLGRVHRYIKTVAMPAQYSLYVVEDTANGIRAVRDRLAELIDSRRDDVRIYLLPMRTKVLHYGRRSLPDGLLLAQADPAGAGWKTVGAHTNLEKGNFTGMRNPANPPRKALM